MKSIKRNDLGFVVEQCPKIKIDDFLAQAKQKLKEQLIKASLEIDGYEIGLQTSKMVHGGVRYWFECPQCRKRVGRLYKHPLNQTLACRQCHCLEYRCRRFKGMVEADVMQK